MKDKINSIKEKIKSTDRFKLILLIVVFLVVICSVIIAIYIKNNKKEEPKKTVVDMIPKELYKEQKLGDLKISNIKFEYKNQIFTYIATVTNTGKKDIEFNGIKVYLIQGKKRVKDVGLYNKTTIKPKQSIEVKNQSTNNYTEVDKLEYELIK